MWAKYCLHLPVFLTSTGLSVVSGSTSALCLRLVSPLCAQHRRVPASEFSLELGLMNLLKCCYPSKHLTLQKFTSQENRSLFNICGTGIKYLGKINHFYFYRHNQFDPHYGCLFSHSSITAVS